MSIRNLSLQPARSSDVDILVGFMRELYGDHDLPFDKSLAHQALSVLIEHPEWGEVWCLQRGDRPIGYAVLTFGYSLEYGGRDAFIDEIYVVPSERRQGIGTKTLDFLCDRCSALGIGSLHLEVEPENGKAQRVYRDAGFVEHRRILMTRAMRSDQSQ